MEYLLDTHTFIWFINGQELPKRIVDVIKNVDNKVLLSIASVWEIAIKFSLGKLVLDKDFDRIQRIFR